MYFYLPIYKETKEQFEERYENAFACVFRCFSSKLSSFLQFSNVNDYAAHFSGFKYTSSI